jgi:hypothetical protein
MKSVICQDVMLPGLIEIQERLGGSSFLELQDRKL